MKKIRRVNAKEGYDLWSETYDETPNPVVAMDTRHTQNLLAPQPGEKILDAGCGTGRYLRALVDAGSAPVAMDFSSGMLAVARRHNPHFPILQADLQVALPFVAACFDAVLCALIGEHLVRLLPVFQEMHRVLKPEGRLVFSVYHPAMAAAGKEARFERGDEEYRLGACLHTVADYMNSLEEAGFSKIAWHEFVGDEELQRAIPSAVKYLDFPVLLAIEARR
jgi:SAM-dependent methyltransferase